MKSYVRALTIIGALAFASLADGQDSVVIPDPGQVAEQPVPYDLGFYAPDTRPDSVIPEDKADTVVVFSATWCAPCRLMKPTWRELRAEGYRVVYIDLDNPYAEVGSYPYVTKEFIDVALQDRPTSVPTIKLHNSELDIQIGETLHGATSKQRIKEDLWKPSQLQDLAQDAAQSSYVPPQLWHGLDRSKSRRRY